MQGTGVAGFPSGVESQLGGPEEPVPCVLAWAMISTNIGTVADMQERMGLGAQNAKLTDAHWRWHSPRGTEKSRPLMGPERRDVWQIRPQRGPPAHVSETTKPSSARANACGRVLPSGYSPTVPRHA
ncbi:hypothetical protein GGTG_07243 [Gaeumannomyces tritici R3-111a-1]|uniref:Uncharacterized protein n=1 Tax=Gaeumannomyces tritici (strain R3-111a-1) TaxID=644352 RepID=J3P146_GAET3|nr:hypothetical protein GGTG_07243 [Gaeumannomyces tritici R3-111a-1]EJT77331.1 hypothetical protein GGTG_07243 [Gaeumannomyces tritici R3-111a-1]